MLSTHTSICQTQSHSQVVISALSLGFVRTGARLIYLSRIISDSSVMSGKDHKCDCTMMMLDDKGAMTRMLE